MRLAFLSLSATLAIIPSTAFAAPTARGATVPISCNGPAVAAGRAIAKANGLKAGQNPKSCFGKMQIYDGPNHELVVVIPSSACPTGRATDVYGKSRAGPWYSFFKAPVCGSKLSIGPKDPWGDWMLTIDGKHYDSRGEFYVLVNY
jgi:hypothetical protein